MSVQAINAGALPAFVDESVPLSGIIDGLFIDESGSFGTVILKLGSYILDSGLAAFNVFADRIYVCSQQPIDFLGATSTYALGNKNFGSGNAFGAPQTGSPGRFVSSNSFSDGVITANGTVAAWAVVDSINSRFLASGPMTGAGAVTSGKSFSLGVITIREPGQ